MNQTRGPTVPHQCGYLFPAQFSSVDSPSAESTERNEREREREAKCVVQFASNGLGLTIGNEGRQLGEASALIKSNIQYYAFVELF